MQPKNRPGGHQSACLRQTLGGRYGRPITGHLHHGLGHGPGGFYFDASGIAGCARGTTVWVEFERGRHGDEG